MIPYYAHLRHFVLNLLPLVAIYYAAVLLLLAPSMLWRRYRRRRAEGRPPSGNPPAETELLLSEQGFLMAYQDLDKLVQAIRFELLPAAAQACWSKTQLLDALSARLRSFRGLHVPAFRRTLNRYIIQESARQCQLEFRTEELDSAWQLLLEPLPGA